jgi:hypothetical protein
VLAPPRRREMLVELTVRAADELGLIVEDEASRTGRALVDREDHGVGRVTRRPLRCRSH